MSSHEQLSSVNQPDSVPIPEPVLEPGSPMRARRKAVLENHDVRIGREVYVQPDEEVMTQISDETGGRVMYMSCDTAGLEEDAGGEPLFWDAAFRPFVHEVQTKFPDRHLALRAIMTSINGTLEDVMGPGIDVLDIVDTLSQGQEKPGSFNVQAFGDSLAGEFDCASQGMALKHVAAYAYKVGLALRFYVDPTERTPVDFAGSIFPAILVYDARGLKAGDEGKFAATFMDGRSAQDTLLAAYVLDKPS